MLALITAGLGGVSVEFHQTLAQSTQVWHLLLLGGSLSAALIGYDRIAAAGALAWIAIVISAPYRGSAVAPLVALEAVPVACFAVMLTMPRYQSRRVRRVAWLIPIAALGTVAGGVGPSTYLVLAPLAIAVPVALARVARERSQHHAHPADAVDEAVVDLRVKRKAVVFEALDEVQLPQRTVHVELVAVQARDEDPELSLAARSGERGMAHVVVEIDVSHGLQKRQALAQQRDLERLEIPRLGQRADRAHAREFTLEVVGGSVVRTREFEQAAHVHWRLARLQQKPRSIRR